MKKGCGLMRAFVPGKGGYQIIPPSPSPTESKRLFCTSVSLLLSRIQGYCYHLFKLEPIIQSEVRQKEKHQYSILTHIYTEFRGTLGVPLGGTRRVGGLL